MPELATIDPVRAGEPGREQVPHEQTREQEERERGDRGLQDDLERDVEDDEVEQRVDERPGEPENAVLVPDLQLLARHPDEELPVLPDTSDALAEPRARPDDARRWGNCGWHTVHGSRPGRRKPCSGRSVAGSMTVRRLTNARPFPPLRSVLSGLRRNARLALASRVGDRPRLQQAEAERAVADLVRWCAPRADPIAPLHAAETSQFSQHGEDGLIAALLERIDVRSRTFVEIGAADGKENCTRRARRAGLARILVRGRPAAARRPPPRSPATST